MTGPPAVPLTLGDRLHALRRSALAQLAEGSRLDTGMLRLVADASAALAAIDGEAVEALAPEMAGRAVVHDDGVQVQVVIYSVDRLAAAVTLSPTAAIRLARELLAAGARRLGPHG
jgi:hypothetical protein